MEEIWKPVPYELFANVYSVSNLGRVKPNVISRYSKNRAEFLDPSPSPRGYLHVSLYANGKARSAFIHRMVCIAFHGEPPFPKANVCHKDDNKVNNLADNLEWGDIWHNAKTAVALGKIRRGNDVNTSKLTEDDVRAIRARYAQGGITQTVLAMEYGVNPAAIYFIIIRRNWSHLAP